MVGQGVVCAVVFNYFSIRICTIFPFSGVIMEALVMLSWPSLIPEEIHGAKVTHWCEVEPAGKLNSPYHENKPGS
jgi:hypothetical protein